MLQENILQYFRPSLSYHLSLSPLFCLFLSGRLGQVLLFIESNISDSVLVNCLKSLRERSKMLSIALHFITYPQLI